MMKASKINNRPIPAYLKLILLLSMIIQMSAHSQIIQEDVAPLDTTLWKMAVELSQQVLLIDAHSHDLLKPASKIFPKQTSLTMMRKGGVNAIVQAFPISSTKQGNPVEYISQELKQYTALIYPDFLVIDQAKKLMNLCDTKIPGILLGLEYSHGLFNGNPENIETYYHLGVRSIGLNNGGLDTLYSIKENKYELSDFTYQLVQKANDCGIACDLTHLPDTVRQMVQTISKAPCYISHANVRGVVDSPFNASDNTLNSLFANEGVICLTFFSEYVSERCLKERGKTRNPLEFPRADIEEFMNHIDYIKENNGIDYVCIGSDFGGSGRISPNGLETTEGFPLIIYQMLKRNYTVDEIRKVMGRNFLNYLARVESKSVSK